MSDEPAAYRLPTISITPGVVGGTPCILGTRIPAETLGALVARGLELAEVAEMYGISVEQVRVA